MVENFLEVFMDDFFVFENDFEDCLQNLETVLCSTEETSLVLNWEKCHFMVREGIVLEHSVSQREIVVDRAKIEAFKQLKKRLVAAPFMVAPEWTLSFEFMCDTNDYVVGAVLGQKINKGKFVLFDENHINAQFGIEEARDEHFKFSENITSKGLAKVLEDLCVGGT
ncbi:uncharacterized protein [Gossypium hirsutum]|uniref:Reverse transcriptase/retrotransposon-derived protein RNase H-like domain-containing protein n=1 Tax=Gossypium hirsutum TaxID=3635 RepID=A0A1U8I4U7_GOSHI|nr:uncharacterized protein LOC107892688 [Gossypium hirsutum]